MNLPAEFLPIIISRFQECKSLGEKTFVQLTDEHYNWRYNKESNSIAMIVHHLHGNMTSRWTDFLNSDGEKPWRNRDSEFDEKEFSSNIIHQWWNDGWKCVFNALNDLEHQDLEKIIIIRGDKLYVLDALLRQLAHYSNHVGQIIYIAKMILDSNWNTLSIPKGKSNEFNQQKWSENKRTE